MRPDDFEALAVALRRDAMAYSKVPDVTSLHKAVVRANKKSSSKQKPQKIDMTVTLFLM